MVCTEFEQIVTMRRTGRKPGCRSGRGARVNSGAAPPPGWRRRRVASQRPGDPISIAHPGIVMIIAEWVGRQEGVLRGLRWWEWMRLGCAPK